MGSFYMEATQINYRRDETLKTVDQKLQELSEESAVDTDIAPVFSKTATYNPGDLVYYKNKLYVCVTQHNGAWAAADFTASTVSAEVSSLRSGLTNYQIQNDLNLEVPDRKNVLPMTLSGLKTLNTSGSWSGNTYTVGSLAFIVNTDSGGNVTDITINGSHTSQTSMIIGQAELLPNTYTINGVPEDASTDTYFINIAPSDSENPSQNQNVYSEYTFIDSAKTTHTVKIFVRANVSVSNKVFTPMIRPATITDPTFAPYIPSVESRIEAVESGLSSLGASANLSNWNDYPDFNGKYIIIGKLCIFNLLVTKADSSWNLAGIVNQQAAIDNTAVAYDAVNQKRIFAKNTSGAIVLQLQTTDTYTNATNVSGCIVLA